MQRVVIMTYNVDDDDDDDDVAMERLPAQLGTDGVWRNQRHSHYARESLETGHCAV